MVQLEGPAIGASMGSNWEIVGYNYCLGARGRRGIDGLVFRIGVRIGIGDDAGDCHDTGEPAGDSTDGWGLARGQFKQV